MEQNGDRGSARRVGIALADRHRIRVAHAAAHLNAVVPVAAALKSAVDLEHQPVGFDFDFGDLHQVALARGGAALPGDYRPGLLVIRAGGFEFQRFLGARQQNLHRGVLRHQAAGQLYPVFKAQLRAEAQRWQRAHNRDGGNGSHTQPPGNPSWTRRLFLQAGRCAVGAMPPCRGLSVGGSVMRESCRRIGAFHKYARSANSTMEVSTLASGP